MNSNHILALRTDSLKSAFSMLETHFFPSVKILRKTIHMFYVHGSLHGHDKVPYEDKHVQYHLDIEKGPVIE